MDAGADAIGLNFYSLSPRYVEIDRARQIARSSAAFVNTVGVFVDPDQDYLREVLSKVPLDIIQFHGDESPEFCVQADKPYIKVLRVKDDVDLESEAQRFASSRGILLDTFVPNVVGGTGETFSWEKANVIKSHPVIIAGGINHTNVKHVIAEHTPYALDLSSGVEQEKGIKSPEAIRRFMQAVQEQDQITYASYQ